MAGLAPAGGSKDLDGLVLRLSHWVLVMAVSEVVAIMVPPPRAGEHVRCLPSPVGYLAHPELSCKG